MYGYGSQYPGMEQGYSANPYIRGFQGLQQPQVQPMQITRVNGENGAKAFQMPPNSSIMLLDETAPIVWLKQTDGAGYPTCTPYQIAPYQAEPKPDYNSLNERITRLESVLNEQSNVAADAKQKRGKPTE